MKIFESQKITVFTSVRRVEGLQSYSEAMFRLMKRNEDLGFNGILFFENHSNDLEPWVFAQELFCRTRNQHPFIAINPAYAHPYSATLKVLILSNLYRRKIYLNFIAGTSRSDLMSIGDDLPHSQRYHRLKEYIQVVSGLLENRGPFSFDGEFYTLRNVTMSLCLEKGCFPEFFISGSSAGADEVRKVTRSGKMTMAKSLANSSVLIDKGVCFGIVARSQPEEAWDRLEKAYGPEFPEYKEVLDYSLNNTDAVWKRRLLEEKNDHIFCVEPFKNFVSDSPYLVGSYSMVADYICEYIKLGIDTFILEADDAELEHIVKVFDLVLERT